MFKKNLNNIWRWGARGEMGEGEEGKSVSGKYQSFQCATLFPFLFKKNKYWSIVGLPITEPQRRWCESQTAAEVLQRTLFLQWQSHVYNGNHTFTQPATRLHSQSHVYNGSHTFTVAVTRLQCQSHVYNASHMFTMPITFTVAITRL